MTIDCNRSMLKLIKHFGVKEKLLKKIHSSSSGCVYLASQHVLKIQIIPNPSPGYNSHKINDSIQEVKLSKYISDINLSPTLIKGLVMDAGQNINILYVYDPGQPISISAMNPKQLHTVQISILNILHRMSKNDIVYLDMKIENFIIYNGEIRIIDFDSDYCFGQKLVSAQKLTLINMQIILFSLGTRKHKFFVREIRKTLKSARQRQLIYDTLFSGNSKNKGVRGTQGASKGELPHNISDRLRILFNAYVPVYKRGVKPFFDVLYRF